MDVHETTTVDGVTVVTERMPTVRSVAVGAWVPVGSRDEVPGEHGCSHFLEHTLFKGTARRTARDIAEELDAVGGELNAFTAREVTCFHGRTLDRDLDLLVDVVGDMLTAATNDDPHVEAERQVVLSELDIHADTPDDVATTQLVEQVIGDHPLARDPLGTVDSVESMPRDRIHGFFERWYRPQGLVVTAAGHLEHDHVVDLVLTHLGDLGRPGGTPGERTAPPPVTEATTRVTTRPVEQVHVAVGGRGLAVTDPRRAALGVLDTGLGSGMSSRLFQAVREERGLAYSTYSWTSAWADAGMWGAYAGVSPARYAEALEVLLAELDALPDTVTDAEVERAKGSLQGSVVLGGEDSGARMARLGRWVTAGIEVVDVDTVLGRIAAVTRDDVRALADELLGGTRHLSVVGAVDEATVAGAD